MEIADLNFFLAVARAGGISRASKELLTVQSNISTRIRSLEDELGVELFRRHARGVRHPDLVCEPMFVEQLVLISGLRIPDLDWAAVAERPRKLLVLRSGCAYRARLQRLFDQRGLPDPEIVEFGTLEGILGCVAAGMGMTLLPVEVVKASPASAALRVHHLAPAEARVETVFIRRADAVLTPALSRFLWHTHEQDPPAAMSAVELGEARRIS